jgi:PAS domain S-box-containing protein
MRDHERPGEGRQTGSQAWAPPDEATLRSLIDQVPVTVYIDRLDDISSNVYMSPQLESELGYTTEEWAVDEELLLKVLHPDDRERVLAEHRRSRDTGEPFRMEYRMVARDGTVHWFLDEATVIPHEAGTPRFHHGFLLDITERKKLEEALRHSEEELRRQNRYVESLLEISPIAIVTLDLDRVVTSWNLAAEALFGHTRAEAIGRDLDDLIADRDDLRAEAAAYYDELVPGGRFRAMTRRGRKDGTLVDVELFAVLVTVEGRPTGYLVVYHDVTALRARHEAERRYRQLVEQLPLVTYVDEAVPVASSIYVSPQVEGLLGYPPEDWLADPGFFPKLLHPDDREWVLADLERTLAAGISSWALEYRLMARDGRTVWVRDEAIVERDEDGTARYVQGFLIDITERQRAENALRRSEAEVRRQKQFFESLLELSSTAIVTVDLGRKITSWNPAAERLFGYTEAEACGRNVDDLVARSEELHAEAVDISQQAGMGGVTHLVTRRTRKDGTLVDVDVRAAPVFVGGKQVGMHAIYHDISELLRARRQAEAATEAKSAFLATMSHEIRTPMNAVIGMTELLLDTALSAEQRNLAEIIRTSGDALLAIINDILDFSKIEAGRLDLERSPFDVRGCIEAALDVVATRAAEKGLDLAYLLHPATPRVVVGDVTRLREILINLLSNAVKFTEAGEVVLSVSSEPMADGRHRLHFAVRDTGIGIPADRMDRLFQSFSQLDASTTRRYGGTGLGLAISQRLTEMMGGTMWVESRAGEGSTFSFTVLAEEAPSSPPAFIDAIQPQLEGQRLLVVDDNATNRTILVRQAESWGMDAQASASPAEALRWIRRGDPFDLAIIDMQMPEMDGRTLAAEIRRHRDALTLPLILLTSLGHKVDHVHPGGNFAATLTKPIKASQLYEAAVGVLARQPSAAPPTGAAAQEVERAPQAGLRILLTEDNELNRTLAVALLDRLGCRADIATNGLEALEALRHAPYDVVLMDVEMPEMDGLEATRRIRAERPPDQQPRIIAMTANAMQGDRERCLAAGMDDYLSKPIRRQELAAALARGEPRAAPAQEPPVQDEGILDPAAIEQLRTLGDAAFLSELIDTFLADAPALVETLRRSLAEGDAEDLRRAAHTLKSNARTFGATSLAEACQELETAARAGALEDVAGLMGRVEARFAKARVALEAVPQEVA